MNLNVTTNISNTLGRDVYCLLGLTFDSATLRSAETTLLSCIDRHQRCFLSTPNLNWLTTSATDEDFRNSVYDSDLSIADGMPIVWLSRLLGIPIKERVAGSDLINQLETTSSGNRIRIFFFGGEADAGQQAMQKLNAKDCQLEAVGALNPGFGSIEDMSTEAIISQINQCSPDFIVVSLGARKGQDWIQHNQHRLNAPLISHLGAVVNFYAGTVSRAPHYISRIGAEWLWRIYNEPTLYRRYAMDLTYLVSSFFRKVLPYYLLLQTRGKRLSAQDGSCTGQIEGDIYRITLSGNQSRVVDTFKVIATEAVHSEKAIHIDFADCCYIDARFTGSLLLLRRLCENRQQSLSFNNISALIERIFYYQNVVFLYK